MSKLVETALIPFGANRNTNCVDGALLHARPAPINTGDKTLSQRFSLLYVSDTPAAIRTGAKHNRPEVRTIYHIAQ